MVTGLTLVITAPGQGSDRTGPTSPADAAPGASPASAPVSASGPEAPAPSASATYPIPSAGVDGPSWLMTHDGPRKWMFRDARTGTRGRSGGPDGHEVTGIAALGDEKTFYLAARKTRRGGCGTSLLQRLRLERPGRPDTIALSDLPGTPLQGEVGAIDISHDGTRLAYAIRTGSVPGRGGCGSYELRVVDLRSGATRSWTGGDATPLSLGWAPDDRTLLLRANPCPNAEECSDYDPSLLRLDTRGSGATFTGRPTVPGTGRATGLERGECGMALTASSRTEVFAAQMCAAETGLGTIRIVVLDPVSGRVLREVATISGRGVVNSLAVTPDGRHLLLSAWDENRSLRVLRIDDGEISQLPPRIGGGVW